MSRSVFLVVFLLFYFTGSLLGLKETLTTSGRDVSYEVKLTVPVNLYGEYHPSLFVSRILAFLIIFLSIVMIIYIVFINNGEQIKIIKVNVLPIMINND